MGCGSSKAKADNGKNNGAANLQPTLENEQKSRAEK